MPVEPARAKSLFLAASDLPAVDHAAFLHRECGDDADLRDRVEALLRANEGAPVSVDATGAYDPARGTVDLPSDTSPTGTFGSDAHRPSHLATGDYAPDAATGTFGGPKSPRESSPATTLGTVIAGRYTLVEVIGEGGMGSVYLASQTEPVKRQVALKLIKTGMDSKGVLARFDAERQALAMMDHPNIARIYDGGVTPAGQPFFVMELVKGVPLTEYCDQKRLTVDARLQLFVSVCQAVQHAHQKGIIHRDLKPGNVLVTEVDGRPTPKVIDFGVAKATELKLTDMSFADTGVIVGTPAYMSPEQADPSSMDIDTRTDVYALGVMLYELLTGSPPIDSKQFKRGAILEMLRMVREVEPPRPSTKLSTADALPNIAANRSIEPAKLARLLRGELDWVVMKALEKDRTRRYDTANGLARDLQRYLANEVVEARPPSSSYRLKKFVKRNKAQVTATGLVLLAVLAGFAGTIFGLIRAEQQRAEADQARQGEADRAEGERLAKQDALAAATAEKGAKEQAEMQRDRAAGLLSVSQAERGQKLIEQGDPRGLLYLVEARRTVEHLPQARDARTRMWQGTFDSLPKKTVKTFDVGVKALTAHFSPDGARLFIGVDSNQITVCDFATEKILHRLALDESPVWWARTSPDGNNLFAHSGAHIEWWDVRAEPRRKAAWANGSVPVGWSRNLRWLLNGTDRAKIQLVDLKSGTERPLGALGAKLRTARRVLVSDDGKWLAASSLDSLQLYSLALDAPPKGRELRQPDKPSVIVEDLYFTEDGRWLFERTFNELRRYDTTGSVPAGNWPSDVVTALSPDTKTMLIQNENDLRLLDTASGRITGAAISPKGARVTCAAFSPDSAVIATGAQDGKVMLWDGRTGTARGEFSREPGAVERLAFDPAGRWLAVTCDDGQVRARLFVLQNQGARPAVLWPKVRALASGGAGRLLVADGRTLAWRDLDSGKATELFKGAGEILCGATGDGQVVAVISENADESGTVRWWRGGDFRKHAAELPCGGCTAAAFSPDGGRLAAVAADSGTVHVWDVAAGKEVAKMSLPQPMETVWVAIRWSPDGRWLGTRNGFGSWQLWDLSSGKGLAESDESFLTSISPDWRYAIGGKGVVDIRDPRNSVPRVPLSGEQNIGAFDASGSLVSAGRHDNTIRVWETATGRLHAPVMHGTVPHYLDFTPDAKTLVTLGRGGLRFWDVDLGLSIGSERRVPGEAFDFSITPDGRYVVVPLGDGTEVWRLPHARASLAEMEHASWLHTGSRLGPAGDFESIPAAELRLLSKE